MEGGFIAGLALRGASMGARTASAASRAARTTRTFSVAGKSGPVSRGKGFKPPTKPKPKPAPKPAPKPDEKVPTDPKKIPQDKDGMSATGAIPPGGLGQSSGYGSSFASGIGSVASGVLPGIASSALTAGMGAAGAFSEGTSTAEINKAMEKGDKDGLQASDTVAHALAAVAGRPETSTVSGKSSEVKPNHVKKSCPCSKNIEDYKKVKRGLSEGLRETFSLYNPLDPGCDCLDPNKILANNLKNKILSSNNILMTNGRKFGDTAVYQKLKGTRGKKIIMRGGLAGTRKKARGVIHKKSRTRKQRPQSRRRTRKN